MSSEPRKELSLFDSLCIIVGIIVGAGIYETTPAVAAGMGGWAGVIGVWLAGGLLALSGALCYAELAAAYPRSGGDYVYLRRAFGPGTGFLFGWFRLLIIRPGDIALMAFVFARYARALYSPFEHSQIIYAALAVIILTAINIPGVRQGTWTQNLLTSLKIIGILVIVVSGFIAPVHPVSLESAPGFTPGGMQLALILVLFTYGGWNEMAYVAAEVKRPDRNIVRALVFGTVLVTVLYILINAAFLYSLGLNGMAASEAIAVETVSRVFPATAGRAIAVLICISALGAVNGLIFTGARISYAMGSNHVLFKKMGKWDARFGTPVWALVFQAGLSLGIILLAGSFIDTILYSAPVIWAFFLATAVSLFVLRRREPGIPRPYRVSAYPVPLIVFCLSCLFMLYNSVSYAWQYKPYGLALVCVAFLAGISAYQIFKQADRRMENR